MEHNHCKCEHKNLKYCPHCDIVYCEDCKKEWSTIVQYQYSGNWTNAPSTTLPYNPSNNTVLC